VKTFNIEKTDTQCVVTWRLFAPDAIFMLIPLVGMTAAGVLILYTGIVQREIKVILFSLPVWGLYLFLFTVIVHTLVGKTKFVLDENGLDTIYTCLMFKWERQFNLAEIRHFEKNIIRRPKGGKSYSLRVDWLDDEAAFSLPTNVLVEELDDLCGQLNGYLAILKRSRSTG